MFFNFRLINETSARQILDWRYESPYDFYNSSGSIDADLTALLDRNNCYFGVTDAQNNLVAYFCYGQDGQVSGGDYTFNALDIGCGLHPDLTGRGFGLTLMTAGLDFARSIFAPSVFRATVAAFNKRALRLCQKAEFQAIDSFDRTFDGKRFVILLRKA